MDLASAEVIGGNSRCVFNTTVPRVLWEITQLECLQSSKTLPRLIFFFFASMSEFNYLWPVRIVDCGGVLQRIIQKDEVKDGV